MDGTFIGDTATASTLLAGSGVMDGTFIGDTATASTWSRMVVCVESPVLTAHGMLHSLATHYTVRATPTPCYHTTDPLHQHHTLYILVGTLPRC